MQSMTDETRTPDVGLLEERERTLAAREAHLEQRETAIEGMKVIGAVLVVLFVVILVGVLGWTFVEATKLEGSEMLGLVQVGIGGIAGLGVAVVAGWRAWGLERQVRQGRESLDAAERRAQVAELEAVRQRLDQRFGEAALLIGHEREDTRIAGLLALERLLREKQFEDEHWTIIQLLVSFVRKRTREHRSARSADEDTDLVPPEQDAQVALAIIGRRPRGEHRTEDMLDFRSLHLERADLTKAHLKHADLRKTHLKRAFLIMADCERAFFIKAELEEADLRKANLEGAHFMRANLRSANLRGANLKKANLRKASIRDADFTGATLDGITGLTYAQAAEAMCFPSDLLKNLLEREERAPADERGT